MKLSIITSLILLLILLSCNEAIKRKNIWNDFSSEQKNKFQTVIDHYSAPKDSLKLKAAFFIFRNIHYKYYYDSPQLRRWDSIFTIIKNKPEHWKLNLPWYSKELDPLFDSIINIHGPFEYNDIRRHLDVDEITSEYLINNIDMAFDAWQQPWSKEVNFENFCEYILPYRCDNEQLENWRQIYSTHYQCVIDSVLDMKNRWEVATKIAKKKTLTYNEAFTKYPVPISPNNLIESYFGKCSDLSNHKTLSLRSIGIPVAIDFVPASSKDFDGHEWNVLLDTTGKMVPFNQDMDKGNAKKAYPYNLPKVYRKTYSNNQECLAFLEEEKFDVPIFLRHINHIDVTSEYTQTSDFKISLKECPNWAKHAYICNFKNGAWLAVDYAPIEEGFANFKHIGRGFVYMVMYYKQNTYYPASEPFIIHNSGKIEYLVPQDDNRSDIRLTRKYPEAGYKVDWRKTLIGACFQGANNRDFNNAVTLARITTTPRDFQDTINIENLSRFRFFRLLFNPSHAPDALATIAEIEFFDLANQTLKGEVIGTIGIPYNSYLPSDAFDKNLLTFYEDASHKKEKYLGLDLGKGTEKSISKIAYCARTDLNGIQPGDIYELFVWRNGRFESLGCKIATDRTLRFKDVPFGGLFWLKDLSGGKEERIFTYENGCPNWW